MTQRIAPFLIFCAFAAAAAQRDLAPPPITVGTRLVQVDVLIRDKNGPVTNLTRDDFTILDQGRRQKIAIFQSSADVFASASAAALPLPAGAISNRLSRAGRPAPGATVILFDLINTNFDVQAYARTQMLQYLATLHGDEKIAIYALGKTLRVVQDFTDDPKKLVDAVRAFDPKLNELITLDTTDMSADELAGYEGDAPWYVEMRANITNQAIATIAQHMSGLSGRKSLIWLASKPGINGTPSLRAANINVYPVLARSVGTSGIVGWLSRTRENGVGNPPPPPPSGNELEVQRANRMMAAALGGAGFNDAKDLAHAVQQAEEDATHTYTLGFYPAEDTLDAKFHALTVTVNRKSKPALEIRYRPGYLALRAGVAVNPAAAKAASTKALFENPLNATAIGLTARATSPGPAKIDVELTIDLHDLHFETLDGQHVANLETAYQVDGAGATGGLIVRSSQKLRLTDEQLRFALEQGLTLNGTLDVPGADTGLNPAIRIVVRDVSTGQLGSLRVPLNPSQR